MALEEGALIWLAAIYAIDLESDDPPIGTRADLKSLTQAILEAHPIWIEGEEEAAPGG